MPSQSLQGKYIEIIDFIGLVPYSHLHHFGKIDFHGKSKLAYYSACFHQIYIGN